MKPFLALFLLIFLSACVQSEKSCLDRLESRMTDYDIAKGVGLEAYMVWANDDLDVCDYTVHMGRLIKI